MPNFSEFATIFENLVNFFKFVPEILMQILPLLKIFHFLLEFFQYTKNKHECLLDTIVFIKWQAFVVD